MTEDSAFPSAGVDTIVKVARWAAQRYRHAPALVADGQVMSFVDYVDAARLVARALYARGVRHGDRVAIWAPNSMNFAVFALGVHLSGAALVPINTRFKSREAAEVIDDSGSGWVLTVAEFLGTDYSGSLGELYGDPEKAAAAKSGATPSIVNIDSLSDFLEQSGPLPESDPGSEVAPGDIATIIYTSGTTGRAKGAMLTHSALVRSYWVWGGLAGQREGDRLMLTNPCFHAFGLMVGLLSGLMRGVTCYPVAVFNAPDVMQLIEAEQITYYPAPPTVFHELLAHQESSRARLDSLRTCVTGATSIPAQLIDDLFDRLGFEEVFIPYGLTEGTGVATITRSGDDRKVLKTTAGKPLPGVQLEIRLPGGGRAAVDAVGEIAIRGFNVMAGYLEASVGDRVPRASEEWLMTGDLGCLDEAGNLSVVGRLKDVVIVGGFNVYPAQVEACLLDHPAVSQAAVVGVRDAKFGEVPCACLVLEDGQDLVPTELDAWCRERLANFKVPRHYLALTALPRNASGKVLKSELEGSAAARLAAQDAGGIPRTGPPARLPVTDGQ